MAKVGKKYAEAAKLFDKQKQYDVAEAIDILKKMDTAKFDETVELAVNLNVIRNTPTSRSAAPWYCPTALVNPRLSSYLLRAIKKKKL